MGNKTIATPKLIEEIKHLASLGWNPMRIATHLGLYRDTVKNIAKKNNIPLAHRVRPESFEKEKKFIKAQHNKCGYIRETRVSLFAEQGCSRCQNTGVSAQESEVAKWLESLGFLTSKYKLSGNKTRPKEVDIFIESKKLGIEYCGLYWHSEKFKEKNYHKDKMDAMNSAGYRLITIFEDEWVNRRLQVENFIKSVLGHSERKVGARKCEIREVSSKTAKQFLKDNHIQGSSRGSIVYFGIYNNEELLGVMTLGRHHRGMNDLVLDRLCFLNGVTVSGGASKLLKCAIEWGRSKGYSNMISWSDNRWSQGGVYEALGFVLEEELKPDYSYVREGVRFSKQSLKKTKEEKQTGKTERQLREEQGYERIWDCGKKRWTIKL